MPRLGDLAPGSSIGSYVAGPIEPLQIMMTAALLRDPVPTHYDVEATKALGLGDTLVNQGFRNSALMIELVYRFAGDSSRIRDFRVRMLQMVHAGDRVECSGTVTAIDPETMTAFLDIEARIDEVPTMKGTAAVLLDP